MITNFGYGQPERLILNYYPRAKYVFSVRRLRYNYLGPCMRIRRSSDNAETDINFLADNEIDAAAITSFLGGSNGFAVTLYDQSGNANHATQTTASRQNRVYTNKLNTKVAVGNDTFDISGARYELTTPITRDINFYGFVSCGNTSSTTASAVAIGSSTLNNVHLWVMRSGVNAWVQTSAGPGASLRATTANTVRNSLITEVYDNNLANRWRLLENSSLIGSNNTTVPAAVLDVLMAAGPVGGGGTLGVRFTVFSEIIVFNGTHITPTEVTTLQNDIINYYGF